MGYRMKYTGEEVENRLDKVDGIEESIAAIDGRVTEAESKITEAEGKIAENESKIAENESKIAEVDEATKTNAEDIASLGGKVAEVEGKADANAGKIAEVEGKANANTESITEIGGKVTEIEGGITEINGDIEALLESVAAVEAKADRNNKYILQLGEKFYVTDFTMTAVRAAAATGTLSAGVRSFYTAITSGRLVYIRDNVSSGAGMGACVPQTYEKNGIATAVIYDTVDRKWYTLSAAQSDRYITVTASDTINLMANEIYTTEFTVDDILVALDGGDIGTLNASDAGFVSAVNSNKPILIPDGTGGGSLSLSVGYNRGIFLLGEQRMMVTLIPFGDYFSVKARFFNAIGYGDIEKAYKLPGNDNQSGGAPGETMMDFKVCYRSTACPNFTFGTLPQLRVGEVINLRYIFTTGVGNVSVHNSNWSVCRNTASSTETAMRPAILDITAINPAETEKIVVFYKITKFV